MKTQTAKRKQRVISASLSVVVFGLGGTLAGCNTETSRFVKLSSSFPGLADIPRVDGGGARGPVIPPPTVVCDPFSQTAGSTGADTTGSKNGRSGVKATLYSSAVPLTGVNNYLTSENLVNAEVFSKDINVPTRAFDAGFPIEGGNDVLRDRFGNELFEYFAMVHAGEISLEKSQRAGFMHFATLSDDGSILEIKNPVTGAYEVVVDNDGNHGTRFKVANRAIYMDHKTRLSFRLKYYQGPMYHIANILMWRNVADNSAVSLAHWMDGHSSNNLFFDSIQTPSVAGPKYQDLLSDGWRPLNENNFSLAATEVNNPCVK